MAEGLFNFVNLLPLPIWLSMILFPRARFTQRMVLSYWSYIGLGAIYTALLLVTLFQGTGFDLSFDALRRMLGSEWGFLTGWVHYLALDLFAGVWIFRDAKYWGLNPTLFLVLTLFAGPLGLAAYLVVRQRRSKTDPVRTLN